MDVFLLGAGRPKTARSPAALKKLGNSTSALDIQLRSFIACDKDFRIHFLGGFQVEEVARKYPNLNFTVIPNWQDQSILHTALRAPFSDRGCIFSYTDTVFGKEIVSLMLQHNSDIAFCIDCQWEDRYVSRTEADKEMAEKVNLAHFGLQGGTAEFTGLVKLSPRAVKLFSSRSETDIGKTLVDLIYFGKRRGLTVDLIDISGHWAEFNAPADIARFVLGTKAETLQRLKPLVQQSHIGAQVVFSTEDWRSSRKSVLTKIRAHFPATKVIVRSSAVGEDGWEASKAGAFASVLNVSSEDQQELQEAIDEVITSYGEDEEISNQVFVQQEVKDVKIAGVVLTCGLATGAPYYKFNFDDETGTTEAVTRGTDSDLRTIIVSRFHKETLSTYEPKLAPVLNAVTELEGLLNFEKLDIEFAVDEAGRVHIFQVRPIIVDHDEFEGLHGEVRDQLRRSAEYCVAQQAASPPFLVGGTTIFGNMPDWNPAEIIGESPKPLAFSLYRHLITNGLWAQQRAEYGYRNVSSKPLIVNFAGHPYVDVRLSLNSFVPAMLDEKTAGRLVDAYLDILMCNPSAHDKIEFDVAFTTWTPSLAEELNSALSPYGFTSKQLKAIDDALKAITVGGFQRLENDLLPLAELPSRRKTILESKTSSIEKFHDLIEDCRGYGILPFAHAARAAFSATSLLNSFVKTGAITDNRRLEFLKSIKTVSSEFEQAKDAYNSGEITLKEVTDNFGHLRPGTYEITSKAYWESPEFYLSKNMARSSSDKPADFYLREEEKVAIAEGLYDIDKTLSPETILRFIGRAIKAREFAKFEFTKNLSVALDQLIQFGKQADINREDLAFLEHRDLELLRLNLINADKLIETATRNRDVHSVTQMVDLPPLLMAPTDFYIFEQHASQANFITNNDVVADALHLASSDTRLDPSVLEDRIIIIAQADPGYDWLFGKRIVGLITQYGGANSHMAIRAAESNVPAAIGVGEKVFRALSAADQIHLDCGNKRIHIIR